MLNIILPLAILAVLCFCLYRIPYFLSQSSGYLPTTRYHLTRPIPLPQGWTVDWKGAQLSLTTKDYNAVPRLLLGRWKGYQMLLGRCYAAGGAAGVLGLFGSLGGAIWAVIEVWGVVWEEFAVHSATSASTTLVKRSWVDLRQNVAHAIAKRSGLGGLDLTLAEVDSLSMTSNGLSPLIPGITIPFAHLPTIILVLVLCQVVHELGHAFSASLDGISPSKFGLNIHYGLPSMAVSFSSAVDRLPPSAQIRLAAAGAWHNLITFAVISMLALAGIWRPLWKDVGEQGRVIQSVDFMSPLSSHLRPGDLVTHLDDIFVGGSGVAIEDQWDTYLHAQEVWDDERGWCISAEQWESLVNAPCTLNGDISFNPTTHNPDVVPTTKCFSPHPILDSPMLPCPCTEGHVCVRPSLEEQVLRIRLAVTSSPDDDNQSTGEVVLWSGPREEVLHSIKFGRLTPRLFPALVLWLTVFLNYILTVSLSLYFFNLLPLPGTDGSHLLAYLFTVFSSRGSANSHRLNGEDLDTPLRAILHTPPRVSGARSRSGKHRVDSGGSGDETDVETGRYGSETDSDSSTTPHQLPSGRQPRRRDRWKGRLRKGIEFITLGFVGFWVAGWAMIALLRSS